MHTISLTTEAHLETELANFRLFGQFVATRHWNVLRATESEDPSNADRYRELIWVGY